MQFGSLPFALGSLFNGMSDTDLEVVTILNQEIAGGQNFYTISEKDHLKVHSIETLDDDEVSVIAVDAEGMRKDVDISLGATDGQDVVWVPCEPLKARIAQLRKDAKVRQQEERLKKMHAVLNEAIEKIEAGPKVEVKLKHKYELDDGAFMYVKKIDVDHVSGVTMVGGLFVLPGRDEFQLGCIPIHRVVKELKEEK